MVLRVWLTRGCGSLTLPASQEGIYCCVTSPGKYQNSVRSMVSTECVSLLYHVLNVCAKSCVTLCNPMGYSLPGSSVYGILQARILEWVAMFSSRESSWPTDKTPRLKFPALAGRFFTTGTTWEAHCKVKKSSWTIISWEPSIIIIIIIPFLMFFKVSLKAPPTYFIKFPLSSCF